ncbi:hypothetical protein M405DRAFT_765179 [Rhizopogon salebrosus TDB-379]|nr:hypothetical protein M405DRAFT_765179 [Rhizopogon salebrosus TDB-379]
MSVVSSIIHATPHSKNDGFGLEPVSLSIYFEGSAQSALHNSIPLQVTVQLPSELEGQINPVILQSDQITLAELRSVPQRVLPFLPLPSTFNPLCGDSWAALAEQLECWLVNTIRDVQAPEWTWGCDAFWMAFIAAHPDFPRGSWPNWNPQITLEGKFIESWTVDSLTASTDAPFNQSILHEIRTCIWNDFQHVFPFPLSMRL